MTSFAICTPQSNYTCACCGKMLWDCPCPRSIKCARCKLNPEDVEGDPCDESSDGKHDWRDENGDTVPTKAEAFALSADDADFDGWNRR